MLQVETSVVIRRPVEVVFSFLSDERNRTKCQAVLRPMIVEAAVLTGPDTRGAAGQAAGGDAAGGAGGVTVIETNAKLRARSKSGPFEFDAMYYFESSGADTRITWTCQVEASGQYQFAEALAAQLVAVDSQVSLSILKSLLEDNSSEPLPV